MKKLGKIKIHEIAKELGLGSKEVVAKAQELGIEVTSHMSAVDEKQAAQIKSGFGKVKTTKKEATKEKAVKSEKLDAETTAYIKELEDALLKARIENAYLKELRRLRLAEEALLKEKRESSTVSEDHKN